MDQIQMEYQEAMVRILCSAQLHLLEAVVAVLAGHHLD
jgi:hypothetical protein